MARGFHLPSSTQKPPHRSSRAEPALAPPGARARARIAQPDLLVGRRALFIVGPSFHSLQKLPRAPPNSKSCRLSLAVPPSLTGPPKTTPPPKQNNLPPPPPPEKNSRRAGADGRREEDGRPRRQVHGRRRVQGPQRHGQGRQRDQQRRLGGRRARRQGGRHQRAPRGRVVGRGRRRRRARGRRRARRAAVLERERERERAKNTLFCSVGGRRAAFPCFGSLAIASPSCSGRKAWQLSALYVTHARS